MSDSNGKLTVTWLYIIGACSCWYHGVGFWMGLFWPWYVGLLFAKVW